MTTPDPTQPDAIEAAHNAFDVFVSTLEALASPPEQQCERMGDFNTAWELRDDALAGRTLIGSGIMGAADDEAVLEFLAAVGPIPVDEMPAGAGRDANLAAMQHPAWEPIREHARRLLRTLAPVIAANRAFLGALHAPASDRAGRRGIRWPEVIASAFVVVGLVGLGLYFHSYEAKPFSPIESESSRARALTNCGYSMFDVAPHAMQCATFDVIATRSDTPGCWPECADSALTLRADGTAELVVFKPESERGTFEGSIDKADFRRLANLLAMLALDRRGSVVPDAPDAGSTIVRAGCKGTWPVEANYGGEGGEVQGFTQCLAQVKAGIDWNRRPDETITTPADATAR